jgi:2,4-dienoyl-CoA reductase-like NADH-dependent reductase (Old Yellow Enzyme family)
MPDATAPPSLALADPLTLPGGQTLPNRLAKSALSEQLGDRRNAPTPQLVRLYRRWAQGGAGLLVTGNVMIDRRQLGEPRNVVVEDDRHAGLLGAWADAAGSHGARAWAQINHPGRQALWLAGSARPVAPSAVAPRIPGYVTPRALTAAEIEDLIARFARTAHVLSHAGFEGIQLHAAHGYLVSQFLSPLANVRDDEWGGDAERRRRFVLEVVRAIRGAVEPGTAVAIKLNSADFQRGGFDEEESMGVLEALAGEDLDLIEVSGGTYERPAMMEGDRGAKASTVQREAYFLSYAERLRERVPDTPLMVTGGFRSAAAMVDAVTSRACDVVGLGRPLAVDPDAPKGLLDGTVDRVTVGDRRIGVPKLDSAVDLYWHTRQLRHMGAGREPRTGEGAWRAAAGLLLENGWGAMRRRRGG